MSSPAIYELVTAPITAHSFNKDRKCFFLLHLFQKTDALNFTKIELVVCPNTNDAQIYQYGHSNSKLEATLKGVSTSSLISSLTLQILIPLLNLARQSHYQY
jgi:actin related protein 2/3 complex subunit 1A/1B